jgi:ankyrin repeat protein
MTEASELGRDTDSDGADWTPLHWASRWGHVQVVKELLDHGADIDAKDEGGGTPLLYACLNGHLAVVVELIPNDINDTTIRIFGKRKSRGADMDAKDIDGRTPLYLASREGYLPVVKALVSCGANILVANNEGHPPIHDAVRYRRSAVSKYLL